MMFDKRRGLGNLGLGLLFISGLSACGQQAAKNGIDFDSQGFEGLTPTHFDLLSTACDITGTTVTVKIADGEFAYIFYRTTDSNVVVNANNAGGTECVFPSTDKIVVNAADGGESDGTHKILFDFLSGSFAMGTTTGNATGIAGNGITVSFATGEKNTVEIRGTNSADLITFGSITTTSYASYAFGTTVHTWTDMSMVGVTDILVSTGPGDDVITGQGGQTSTTPLGLLSGNISLTVYGGDGNDTITSGAAGTGTNHLYGNAGSDKFRQLAALGRDVIAGGTDSTYTYSTTATGTATATATGATATATTHLTGTGTGTSTAIRTITTTSTATSTVTNTVTNTTVYTQTDISVDVVDYSARTAPIRVTLGDESVAVKASSTITCVGPSMISDHDGFSITDGDGNTQAYEYRNSVDAVATGSITVPTPGADNALADHDTFTIHDGVNSATFEIKATTAAATSTDTNLVVDVHTAVSAHDVAVAVAAAISNYQTVTNTETDTSVSVTVVPDVTVTAPTAHPSANEAKIALVNNNSDVVSHLITQTGSGNLVLAMTTGVKWASVTDNPPINVYGMTDDVHVATATAAAIPGTASPIPSVTATSSGPVVTVVAVTAESEPSFSVAKDAGVFVVAGISTGSAAPGGNDGDIASSGEQDSIGADVEMVIGSTKDDTIDASEAYLVSHILQGMAGNDTLIIGVRSTVTNTLYGGLGNDNLQGGSGVDTLYGGDGDDFLRGGLENDIIDGANVNCLVSSAAVAPVGATPPKPPIFSASICTSTLATPSTTPGRDTLDYSDRTLPVTANLGTLATAAQIGEALEGGLFEKDTVTHCVNLRGGAGADTLTGDVNGNMIWGGPGDDHIYGGGGSDALYGEMGDDYIEGNAGDDYIYGGLGINSLYGDTPSDPSVVGNDLIDNNQGTRGTIDCGPGDMDVLIPNGGETSTLVCEL